MVDPDYLDRLQELARSLRSSDLPFGGIQVICTGDFCQLPPVMLLGSVRYAFTARCWVLLFGEHNYVLTRVFRQGGDARLLKILREVRAGQLSPESIEILETECRPRADDLAMPIIFALRKHVDASNERSLEDLSGDVWVSQASDSGKTYLLKDLLAPRVLRLKIGAIVMFLRNDLSRGLRNGSLGKVVGFVDGEPSIHFDGAEAPATVSREVFAVDGGEIEPAAKRMQVFLYLIIEVSCYPGILINLS